MFIKFISDFLIIFLLNFNEIETKIVYVKRTALHLAVEKKNEEIIKLLLEHDGIDVNVKDSIYLIDLK